MLLPTNFLASVLCILASSSTATGKGLEFVWLPSQIEASLARDDEYLHLGQYLLLEQELPTGTHGWTTMKIDLPESWQIDAIAVRGTGVHLVTKDSGSYELNGKNVVALSSAILGDSTPTDSELQRVWRRHAAAGR